MRNQLLAMAQCSARELRPGPLATFKQWQALGRHVVRGQKALMLCMPITLRAKKDDAPRDEDTDNDGNTDGSRTLFMYRARWFVLSQTDGKAYEPVELPSWDEAIALQSLGISRVAFDDMNGNAQGYSVGRKVAVSPVAALPAKTLFHELGHVVLGHTMPGCTIPRPVRELEAESVALLCLDALDLPGAEFARGYVQHWATTDDLNDEVAERILRATDNILRAGRPATEQAVVRAAA